MWMEGWQKRAVVQRELRVCLSLAFLVSMNEFIVFLFLVSFYFSKKKKKKQAICFI